MRFRKQIEMDFVKELRKAELLDEAAAKMKQQGAAQLEEALRLLQLGWKGENADLFQSNCRTLLTQITDTAADLTKAAFGVRAAAQLMYQAEMTALKLAIQ